MYLKRRKNPEQEKREKELLRRLLVRTDVEEEWRSFRKKRIRTAALGWAAAFLFAMAFFWSEGRGKEDGRGLIRPSVPWRTEQYDLEVTWGDQKQLVSLPVHGRELPSEELELYFQEAEELFWQQMLGDNESENRVTHDLNFSSAASGTELTASFRPENFAALGADGRLIREGIAEEGVTVRIYLDIRGGEEERSYEKEITLYPPRLSEKETLFTLLSEAEQRGRDQDEVELPEMLSGQPVFYERPKETVSWPVMAGCLLSLPVVFWQLPRQRQKAALKKRERQLLEDYPGLLLKFSLLLKAGLSLRNVWQKIAEEYRQDRMAGKEMRYAYEEMWLSLCRMRSGVSEREEYQSFGLRIGLHPYLRFSGLLEQNLEKGNQSLLAFFQTEQLQAFEERKNQIRKLGEEAGTKLLGPMMLYFIIVLCILLVPAWLSFSL